MTAIPDLGQAHETCGGVKQVYCYSKPSPNKWSKEKNKENKSADRLAIKNQAKSHPIRLESILITIDILNKNTCKKKIYL